MTEVLYGLALSIPVGLLLHFQVVPAFVDFVLALFVGHDRRY